MQIGKLAEAAGVTAKTIRFYEQRGLVPPPPRTTGGYRDYPAGTIQRLRFIRDAQSAGLGLREIREVLAVRDSGHAPCAQVSALLAEHLQGVERRLADLRATRTALRNLTKRAADVDPSTCVEDEICTILARTVSRPPQEHRPQPAASSRQRGGAHARGRRR